jgi:hypothetical protein
VRLSWLGGGGESELEAANAVAKNVSSSLSPSISVATTEEGVEGLLEAVTPELVGIVGVCTAPAVRRGPLAVGVEGAE